MLFAMNNRKMVIIMDNCNHNSDAMYNSEEVSRECDMIQLFQLKRRITLSPFIVAFVNIDIIFFT